MRTLGPLLLGLVVGVVAGVGATKLLVDPPSSLPLPAAAAPRVARADDETARHSAADAPFPSAPPAVEAERVIAPAVATAPSGVVDEAMRAARSAPAAARPQGDRVIRGRVARADGSGVEGVVMRARRTDGRPREPGPSSLGNAAPPPDPLDRAVQRAIESWYEQAGRRAETTTDGDGRYELAQLPAGKWWLEPWCAGFAIDTAAGGQPEVEPDATIDFLATPIERLPIAVALPDGGAPPRAALVIKSGSRNRGDVTSLWTPDARELALKPGSYELRATLGDPEVGPAWSDVLASDWTTVTIVAGIAPSPLRLALRGAPGVRGRIVYPPGLKQGNALVRLAPAPASGEPDLAALANDGSVPNSWAGQGTYLFRDVAPGRWVVAVSKSWGERIVAHAVVEVRDAMVVQDLVIPAADSATSLVVKVVDPDGALVDDCDFQLGVAKENQGSTSSHASAERKPNGNWWVSLGVVYDVDLAKPWPSGTNVTLTVSTSRFGSKSVPVPSGTRALQVRFAAPAKLRATIAGYEGSGREGKLHLSLDPADLDEHAPRAWVQGAGVAADGTQLFGPVESGAWRLKLELQTKQQWNRRRLATLDLQLAPGDNAATIAIPSLSDVVVEAVGRQGGMMLQDPKTKEGWHEQLDADGRVTFEAMPAGDYVLQSFGGAFEMMRVRVPTAGVVRFEPMVINAARVTIEKRDGTLANAGFEDGDLIVGIDGQEFESSMQMQGLLMQSLGKAKVVFAVERGSRRLTIEVNPREMLDGNKHGGSIEPTGR